MARLFGRQELSTGSPYNELDNDRGRKSHIGDASRTEKPMIFRFALKRLVVVQRRKQSREHYRRIFEMGRRGSATDEEFGLSNNNDG
jgi:hypothetical protein